VSSKTSFILCTRGSALALAQSRRVQQDLQRVFPAWTFELLVLKTTGDKLQTAALANAEASLPKGLFTKELEVALLERTADIAVHSLKDLPTELPEGLILGAVTPRADVRDVLVFRSETASSTVASKTPADWSPGARTPFAGKPFNGLAHLPKGAVVATSSTRRAAQVLAVRPDLQVVPIRGNVGTRLTKIATDPSIDATILAAAGLVRLKLDIGPRGDLRVDPRLQPAERAEVQAPPSGLLATLMDPAEMIPAVGQGAVGLEIRAEDPEVALVCQALNHPNTLHAVTAERAFLKAMGGGCQSPVAAFGRVLGHQVDLSAASFRDGATRRAQERRPIRDAVALGEALAASLR
jgi:porphobilinogen deaminase